ncbi:Aste57867_2421 [Aphanomyces stellatus]|uniref:Carboxypeptidase n=1 Tax=Aphanomyces stellatus TaxID=120398 RepID=A0A485KB94_9STRA|nr:hypothetical protein As57867_002415 [Aphanomyces stellatus]VFT79622.1 Aste57867_2421 [Aphanomyces stellatus]
MLAMWYPLLHITSLVSATLIQTAHQVTHLPNYNDKTPINFSHYAGRLQLPSNGQTMFYWFVESEQNPSTDPLVLWLNGGPGCSSLTGFFTELGPFVVQSDLSVKRNPYAWNRKANMLFLESPSGVGFSQPKLDPSEYNDNFTSARMLDFLRQFFLAYPTYQNRPLYIAGESYAGMYIPHLVDAIVHDNHMWPTVNLHGFAIGNPITDHAIDNRAFLDYYYTHGMISIEHYTAVQRTCNASALAMYAGIWANYSMDEPCANAVRACMDESDNRNLNRYDIYGDVCQLEIFQPEPYRNVRPMHRGRIGPCATVFTQAYLQLSEVQKAIHVDDAKPFKWTECINEITDVLYNRTRSVLPLYPTILSKGLKVLIFSGDADSMVNFMGTQRWITHEGLKLPVKTKWQPWFGPDHQLAGYTEEYQGLNFTTVKGASHMVAATRPLHGLYLFECFLYGKEVCAKFTYPHDNLEYLSGEDVVYSSDDGDDDTQVAFLETLQLWHYALWYSTIVAATIASVLAINRVAKTPAQYAALTGESKPLYTPH